MYSVARTAALPAVGFPIRTSPDQSLVSGSPTLFAATHVLLRLLSPRHPSCALRSLVISLLRPSTPLQRAFRPRSSTFSLHAYLRICSFQRATRSTSNRPSRKIKWSRSGSNRRHPACKAGALPAELRPRLTLVGLDRFELSTPRLSSVCSNQLSYRP
jgi:hypothetical protein